ncbi:MAG: ParA family protein [Gemmataceae bacterium]
MRKIAVLNQKGGVGKTTTAVNLASAMAGAGKTVCLMDLDPQAHASSHLGVTATRGMNTLYDMLVRQTPWEQTRLNIEPNLWVTPSSLDLAAAEVELSGVVGREMILRDLVNAEPEAFDVLVLDCAPSLGVLTLNALTCVDEVIIPLQPHFLALHGLGKLLETASLVTKRLNPALKVTCVVLTLCDMHTKLTHEIVEDINRFLAKSRGGKTPWADAQLCRTRIRRNIKLAECPSFGKSIFGYAPTCHGAEDYALLAQEILDLQPAVFTTGEQEATPTAPERLKVLDGIDPAQSTPLAKAG